MIFRLWLQQRLRKDEAKNLRDDLNLRNPHKQHRIVGRFLFFALYSWNELFFHGTGRSMDLSVHSNHAKKDPWIFQSAENKVIHCVSMISCICVPIYVCSREFFLYIRRSMDPFVIRRGQKDPWIFQSLKKVLLCFDDFVYVSLFYLSSRD